MAKRTPRTAGAAAQAKPTKPGKGAVNAVEATQTPIVAPEGMDKKAWTASVTGYATNIREYLKVSNRANKEALPYFYDAGHCALNLFEGKSRKSTYGDKVISMFAEQVGTVARHVYESMTVNRVWNRAEFMKMIERGLNYSHITRLMVVRKDADRKTLADLIVSQGLTVEAVDGYIKGQKKQNPEYVTTKSATTARAKKDARDKQMEDPARAMTLFCNKTPAYLDVCAVLSGALLILPKLEPDAVVKCKKQIEDTTSIAQNLMHTVSECVGQLTAATGHVASASAQLKAESKAKADAKKSK